MTRLRATDGFTLIELLLASALMLLIMGAALTVLDRFVVNHQRNQQLTTDSETVRNAMDLLARDARSATAYQTTANATAASVLRAGAQDLVFKTVDPFATTATSGNAYRVRTVRYCYVAATNRLLRQVKADAVVPATACPDSTWTTTTTIKDVVNSGRALFTYDTADPSSVTSATVDLFVDSTPGAKPAETPLHSGVFLRNANRPPTVSFTATAGPGRHVQLNGSASLDPDGSLLNYTWKDNGSTLPQTGPVVDWVAPASGTRTYTLTVTDPGGLTDTSAPQSVTVQP